LCSRAPRTEMVLDVMSTNVGGPEGFHKG